MKKITLLIIPALICGAVFTNCDSEGNIVDSEKIRLLCAHPLSTIEDSKVHLKWGLSMISYISLPYEIVEPDKIEIYISENEKSNFKKIGELENGGDYSYTVDKLQNGKPYFFYLVSKKSGFFPLNSDTIMVVPNKKKEFEILQTCEELHVPRLSNVSLAQQKNKIAYVDRYYSWDGGNNCCMTVSVLISNIDGTEKELVEINSNRPSWSPANDKIAFHYDAIQNVGWIPAQIALYDCETKSITQLTNDNYYNYSPVFSENGEFLLFQSSRNTPGTYETNIWLMDLKTNDLFQITDISRSSLSTVERPCWIDHDRFLFHGVSPEGDYKLFESSVSKKQINKLFDSQWNDYTPSISPDYKRVAFISNRSGTSQVWIYHFDLKTYSQITGYSMDESVEQTWNKIEWMDKTTILFTLNDNQLIKLKVE